MPSRRSEPSTACADALGTAGDSAVLARLGIDVEAELGGDHDPVAHRPKRFADHLLVDEGAVDLGRVEEGDAALDRGADQPDAVFLRQWSAISLS